MLWEYIYQPIDNPINSKTPRLTVHKCLIPMREYSHNSTVLYTGINLHEFHTSFSI